MAIDITNKIKLGNEFYGEKSIIVSKSGYGKSYTARVIIEEGLEQGQTFIIIDPQDAYLNLKGFEYIDGTDVKSAKGLGVLLSQTSKNVVISTKGLSIDNQNKLVGVMLTAYKKNVRKGIQTFVIDEMHKFAPNAEKTEAKQIIRSFFQENRSDGVGIIGVTQRPARIDTTILSQADNLFLGRVTSMRDKQALGNYLDNKEEVEKLPTLGKGEFYLSLTSQEKQEAYQIRKCKTTHSGNAPKNLLKEDTNLYNTHIGSVVKKSNKPKENNQMDAKKVLNEIVPTKDSFLSKAGTGVTIMAGFGLNGIVSTAISKVVKSPLPFVSSRTLASLVSTLALNAASNMSPIKNSKVKEALGFAVAGSAAATIGSGVVDAMVALNLPIPAMLGTALSIGTGVAAPENEKSENSSAGVQAVDVNTSFA